MSEEAKGRKRMVVHITLPRAAIIIGVVLVLVCLAAPLFAKPVALGMIRLIVGLYAALFACMGVAGAWQERLRARLVELESGRTQTGPQNAGS